MCGNNHNSASFALTNLLPFPSTEGGEEEDDSEGEDEGPGLSALYKDNLEDEEDGEDFDGEGAEEEDDEEGLDEEEQQEGEENIELFSFSI